MKLWLISQNINDDYDTYDSAVVAAETEDAARDIHPRGEWPETKYDGAWVSWDKRHLVNVEELGDGGPHWRPGVILASFNAG